ncbi:hypothetical protein ACU686_06340 [Yinghuangia aomiensis]
MRRTAHVEGGPHDGNLLVVEEDELGHVIAVLYRGEESTDGFAGDYWFASWQDLSAAFDEAG